MRTRTPGIRTRRGRIGAAAFGPSGSYDAGRADRREFVEWDVVPGGPISDTIGDLPTIRARSRDLVRNSAIATSGRQTTVLGVVGTGLTMQPRIDAKYLGLTETQAAEFHTSALRIWNAAAYGTPFDIERTQSFDILTRKALASAWDNGDMFVVRRYALRPRDILGTKIQLLEADRCSTPASKEGSDRYVAGVELDDAGAVAAYHFSDEHPGERFGLGRIGLARRWNRIPLFDEFGERNVLKVSNPVTEERIGMLRGVPALAPAMKLFKQGDRYTTNELMAAAVASAFTVFVTKQPGSPGVNALAQSDEDDDVPEGEYRLDSGAILELLEGQDIKTANPGRPNANFAPFMGAMFEQMGAALSIPYEVLMRRFTASYSASRAAIELAWAAFRMMRSWFVDEFAQPIYEWVLVDAVLSGLLPAPGFFEDPLARIAYCTAEWVGPTAPQVDPVKEATAAQLRIAARLSTHQREAALLTGADWWDAVTELGREQSRINDLGMDAESVAPVPAEPDTEDHGDDDRETDPTAPASEPMPEPAGAGE